MCGNGSDSYLDENCIKKLNFKINFHCLECRKRTLKKCDISNHSKLIKFLISFGEYENESLKKLIILGKDGHKEIFNDLGSFIAKEFLNYLEIFKDYFLTSVPLTKNKLLKRGFNQAEILVEKIHQLTNLPIFDGLKKIKETKDQAELNFEERLINLKFAFKVEKKPPKNIILIDDIKTTGATLKECAKTLKENGVRNIIALTILR